MARLTDEQVAAIKATYTKSSMSELDRSGNFLMDRDNQASPVAWCAYQDAAEAIAQVVSAFPALLADLEEARREVERLRTALEQIEKNLTEAADIEDGPRKPNHVTCYCDNCIDVTHLTIDSLNIASSTPSVPVKDSE